MTRRTKVMMVAAAAALTLTGCAGLRPGVAAEVGDDRITTRRVDAFAEGLCAYFATTPNGAVTSAQARKNALDILVRSTLANQHGQELDLDVDRAAVEQGVQSVSAAVNKLPDDDREDFLDEVRASLEGDQVAFAAAGELLASQGDEVTEEARSAATVQLYTEWAEEAGIEVDPRFGSWKGLEVTPGSGSLSVAADGSGDDAAEDPAEDPADDGDAASEPCG